MTRIPLRRLKIEAHNRSLGTNSSGYSERTRPDNYCFKCGHIWIPRGRNISWRCPRCHCEAVVPSNLLFRDVFYGKPKKPINLGAIGFFLGIMLLLICQVLKGSPAYIGEAIGIMITVLSMVDINHWFPARLSTYQEALNQWRQDIDLRKNNNLNEIFDIFRRAHVLNVCWQIPSCIPQYIAEAFIKQSIK